MNLYLVITAYYISASPQASAHPGWELKSRILGFSPIEGNHGSANTAAVILRVVDCYGIRRKVCSGSWCSKQAQTNHSIKLG